jgi:hypothetical protein
MARLTRSLEMGELRDQLLKTTSSMILAITKKITRVKRMMFR